MKALVIYHSCFGNTERVAQEIAKALSEKVSVRTLSFEQLSEGDLSDLNLVVMGSPTHKMNLPDAIRPVLKSLPKRVLRGAPAAAFDTSYKMSPFLSRFTAGKKLAQRLRRLGGKRVVPPETFCVMGREGPLFDSELDRAREWGNILLDRIKRIPHGNNG